MPMVGEIENAQRFAAAFQTVVSFSLFLSLSFLFKYNISQSSVFSMLLMYAYFMLCVYFC